MAVDVIYNFAIFIFALAAIIAVALLIYAAKQLKKQ